MRTGHSTMATPSHLSSECPDEICRLVAIVNGCQDNTDGIHAKITLVRSFIAAQKGRANLIDVACWLHLQRAVTIQSAPLLRIVRWQRPKTPRSESDQHADAVQDANRTAPHARPGNPRYARPPKILKTGWEHVENRLRKCRKILAF